MSEDIECPIQRSCNRVEHALAMIRTFDGNHPELTYRSNQPQPNCDPRLLYTLVALNYNLQQRASSSLTSQVLELDFSTPVQPAITRDRRAAIEGFVARKR